ncbi:hypothetical protein [Parasitella parasitica]|uniref:Uncharacterized protein n=1 Tax=Parasitella parasitica TaxID=35722 RepID=A0A0B7MVT6_9FUNG|nr:hypothetical protein [Parasitella parasitica]
MVPLSMLSKFYAVSLVDPVTFEVWAETQVKSATARIKPIILHLDNKKDTSVELRDTSRIGFEWSFSWEGEKYRWVRESRMSNSLECRAIRKTGDICVAQYLPCVLKDEYFGIFSVLGYNMLRCKLTKSRELELIILMSLMTLLDKANDGSWKRDPISKGVQDDLTNGSNSSSSNSSFVSPPVAAATNDYYEDPIPKKSQQKKHKDVRRSQKQIQLDQKHQKSSLSAGNSPAHTPKTSPLPTPSTSTNVINTILSPRLTRQKSAGNLTTASNVTDSPTSLTSTNKSSTNSGGGRLSRLFNTLSQAKQTSDMVIITPDESPADDFNHFYHHPNDSQTKQQQKQQQKQQKLQRQRQRQQQQQQQQQQEQEHQQLQQLQQRLLLQQQQQAQIDQEYYEQHHFSLPAGQLSRFTNEFGNLSISSNTYDNPPSLRNIRWNQEPVEVTPTTNTYMSPRVPQQPQHYAHRSNSNGRRPHMLRDQQRRLSATEYSMYYNTSQPHYSNNYYRYASNSDYYAHPCHQQPVYDYYQ